MNSNPQCPKKATEGSNCYQWRRVKDSNLRARLRATRFRGVRNRPLCQLSACNSFTSGKRSRPVRPTTMAGPTAIMLTRFSRLSRSYSNKRRDFLAMLFSRLGREACAIDHSANSPKLFSEKFISRTNNRFRLLRRLRRLAMTTLEALLQYRAKLRI